MSRQRTALATLLALEALALAVPSIALAQSTQDWTAPLNGNQPGLTQWTLPGPLAADAQGRVLATAYVRELLPVYPPVTPIVAELITLRDSNGLTLWSQRQPTSHSTSQVVASPTGGFLALSSSSAITALQLSWYHPDGVQTWTQTIANSLDPQPHNLAVDSSGTSFLCGSDFSGGVVVAAIDAAGALQWSQNISYGASTSSSAAGLELGGNGALYVRADVSLSTAPYTRSLCVSKLTTAGLVQWTRTAPGQSTTGYASRGMQAIHADGAGVVIGGEVPGAGAADHLGFLARYDAAGSLQWSRTIPGAFPDSCVVDRIAAGPDGVLWVLSETSTNNSPPPVFAALMVSRFDPQGVPLSSVTYMPPPIEYVYAAGLVLGNAGQAWIPVVAMRNLLTPYLQITPRLVLFDAAGSPAADQLLDPTTAVNDETIFAATEAPGHRLVLSGGEGQSYGDASFATQLDLNDSPQGYCTAKVNSLGCTPALTFTGLPSATATSGFIVKVANVRDHKAGLYLYSVSGAAASPFQGGALCVQAPIKRTIQISSAGTTGCSGVYSLDFNAFAHGTLGGSPSAALQSVGTAVYCQAWGRDQGFPAPNNTTLSSALAYVVLP